MKTNFSCALILSAALFCLVDTASATLITSVQFLDGNHLNVLGDYGSGTDTAYLVVDLNNAGVNYAWQFNWNPASPVNGWQMMQDIAGQTNVITSGVLAGSTNPAGDPNFTVNATYYTSFAEHQVTNMQYGGTLGVNNWDFYTGTYNPANVSVANPQGMTWVSSGVGIDETTLSNNEFIGWVDVYPHPPLPTVAELPEPGAALPLSAAAACALMARTRRRARRRA